ncbi:MAG: hypothetical protein HN617_12995 [Planctomycetaceae bacterium]|nr:hypothetical protein [Planctomycetaceae bacterium]
MNNSELISQLEQIVTSNRFSRSRKACLSEFVGREFTLSGILSQITNTTGYLRKQELRKGLTITLRLADCDTRISIRCRRDRAVSIADHDVSQPLSIRVSVTGYDEARRQLNADEIEDRLSTSHADLTAPYASADVDAAPHFPGRVERNEQLDLSSPDDRGDQLLSELEQMQAAAIQCLTEAAEDINNPRSCNVPLIALDANSHDAANPEAPESKQNGRDQTPASHTTPAVERNPATNENEQAEPIVDDGVEELVVGTTNPELANPNRLPNAEQAPRNPQSESGNSEVDAVAERELKAQIHRLQMLRQDILSNQQDPISQQIFGEIISLETGVPVKKVNEIQKEFWQVVMSPAMFGSQREIFNFFPFGDFRLMRDRDLVKMDFKSAPVMQLADHRAVEEYPHSNFVEAAPNIDHPPLASHAIRLAATVAPLVGLSPPITYDVIFETLQLLLKIFSVGKRPIRFADIGEFFPVVLRGTLQYHFKPYRPLIRLATESFRTILSLAEHQGEGQLAFEADKGVPSRTKVQSQTNLKRSRKKKAPNYWLLLILGFILYQVITFLLD